ncbi:hypothetical protein BDA96_03G257500 [Sorghum bicolor]|uniref:Uncharacterized protein n=1 Tax=Sorghum bicolor TaxID=4558 RepID=A0A921RED3_SORBI|nr:hypothetical protein BDA96_03G257500 [Sorghum bicolor]
MSAPYVTSARKPPAINLLLGCVISREIWFRVLHLLGLSAMLPDLEDELGRWWLRCRSMLGIGKADGRASTPRFCSSAGRFGKNAIAALSEERRPRRRRWPLHTGTAAVAGRQ